KKDKDKGKGGSGEPKASRGTETLLRNTYRVHVELSSLADSKANFLISVNSVIMMLVVSHGMSYISNKILLFPVIIVIATCIASNVLAVLCARPRIGGRNAKEAIADPIKDGSNVLFFGTYTGMQKEDFVHHLMGVLNEPEQLYSAMLADLFEMGKVLKIKYRRLQTAYGILLYGLPTGIVLFMVLQVYIILTNKGPAL
ncbi:MAG: Pycsar system effector family protein, partial [Verrucomicrobiales bacterium]